MKNKEKLTTGVLTKEAVMNLIERVQKIPRPEWMDLPFRCEKYPDCKETKRIHVHCSPLDSDGEDS